MSVLPRNWARALTLCLALAAPVAAAADEQQTVVVTHSTKSFAFLTYFAANAMGYFADEGLEIEEVRTGAGSKSLAAVVAGDAEIYLGSTASVFSARSKGIDVKIIAPVVTQLSSSVVVSKAWAEKAGLTEASPLADRMAALRDARIAVSGAGSGSEQALRFVATEAGIDPGRDMTIVYMGSNAMSYLSSMEQGQIDGFCTSPPDTHLALEEFDGTMLVNTAAGEIASMDGFFYIGMIASDDWLAANPEAADKMVRGLQRAMDAIHDPAESAAVGEAVHRMYYPDLDRAVFDRAWEDQRQSVPTTVTMSDDMLEKVVTFTNAFSEERVDPSLLPETYTNEFGERAALPSN